MHRLTFTEILPHKAADLHDFVLDVQRYKEISPIIRDIKETDKGNNTINVETTIKASFLPMAVHYACDLQSQPPDKIKAIATKSPFRSMQGELTFKTLPNGHTEVTCSLEYETGWHPLAIAAAGIMPHRVDWGIQLAKEYLAKKLPVLPDGPATPPAPGPAP